MERSFLLLVAFIFSSGQCQDTDPSRGHGAGLAIQILELHRLTQELAQQLKALQESTSPAVPRVAFTVALGHSLSPVPIDTPVKYPGIISNMGNGYNPATGIFTARVPGMYYFSYTMYSNDRQTNAVVSLMKNSQRMVSTWDIDQDDTNDSATNAAVLQLEAGDSVHIQLYANRELYDDIAQYNTFSGFLLFPL